MNTATRRSTSRPIVILSLAALGAALAMALGPLTPPAGTVTSTNRTLQEVFDKIPAVGGADGRTPLSGGTGSISITQPGSYVLTGNISTSTLSINVNSPSGPVTIDLNGFRVSTSSLTLAAVQVVSCPQFVLRNGDLAGGATCLSISSASGCLIEDIRIAGAKDRGISFNGNTNFGAVVRRCTIVDIGITTTASDTGNVLGIAVGGLNGGCRFEDCTITRLTHNGTTPGSITGIINSSSGGMVSRCLVVNTANVAGSTGIICGSAVVYSGNNVVNFATEYSSGIDGGGNF